MQIQLGYWDKNFSKPLYYPAGEAHGFLCSPTRGGKFRDVIAQILLSFEGSCFVIDPKGQAAAVTAGYRQNVLKQDVYLLNPFKVLPEYLGKFKHATYDPVGSKLDPESDTFAADADNLMDGLMPHGGPEVHWIDSARQLGSGMAMLLRSCLDRWSLPDVYASIADPHLQQVCVDEFARVENDPDPPAEDVVEQIITRLGRFAAMTDSNYGEIRSIVSTAITRLGFLGNRPIASNMRASTVDFAQMKHRPMTVYVILPGRYLAPYAAWMRTITNAWADSCLVEGKGKFPVLGILDEFKTAVGRLGAIDTLNAMGAGYGCQLLTVLQDLNQLKELYPQSWETFLANSGFQLFFGPRDWTTSDYISRMWGTIETRQASQSFNRRDISLSMSSREHRAMLPEQVRALAEDQMVAFVDYAPGYDIAYRRPYFADPAYEDRWDEDPYHPKV